MDDIAANPVAPGREKLVARKQEWAREGRLLTGAHADLLGLETRS
jgi:hypothetical protein